MKTKWMIVAGLIALCSVAQADSITHGGTTVNMDFVNIGTPGNAADPENTYHGNPGAVANSYRIGTYEVKASDWASVIAADSRVGNAGYGSGSQPTAGSSWFEAARFCNWLTSGDAYLGAYQFNSGGVLTNVMTRAQMIANGGLFYALPTEDEWYKAAYFKNGVYSLFANGTYSASGTEANYNVNGGPAWAVGSGAVEQNGTYDMNGNVWEWMEDWDENSGGWIRGGSYADDEIYMCSGVRYFAGLEGDPGGNVGFRVVAIPEPATALSLVLGGLVVTGYRRLRKAYGL